MSITKLLEHKAHFERVLDNFIELVENLEDHSQKNGYKLNFDQENHYVVLTFTDMKVACELSFFGDYSKLVFGPLKDGWGFVERTGLHYVNNDGYLLKRRDGQNLGMRISSIDYLERHFFVEILKALEDYWQITDPDEDY